MLSRTSVSRVLSEHVLRQIFLGEGAFSTVYKVKRLSDGQEYALKKVSQNKNLVCFNEKFHQTN